MASIVDVVHGELKNHLGITGTGTVPVMNNILNVPVPRVFCAFSKL